MIVKQPPAFLPFLNGQTSAAQRSDGLPELSGRGPGREVFALLLQQGGMNQADGLGSAAGIIPAMALQGTALQSLFPDLGQDAPEESSSGFSSILAAVIQLKTIPLIASMPSPHASVIDPIASPNQQEATIRRIISAYTPHYSSEGFRQKIDFSGRASFPDFVNLLASKLLASNALHAGPDGTRLTGATAATAATANTSQTEACSRVVTEPIPKNIASSDPTRPGFLAAHFESNGQPDAIGYDRRGGTSYGIYQLSSRMGTMDTFLKYLDEHAPQWASRLRASGPANTGGREGAMPNEWRRISHEDPERFARLQHDFVSEFFYKPAVRSVQRRTGLDFSDISPALREVIWSTAVQHGATEAARIFERAASRLKNAGAIAGMDALTQRDLIQAVYAERGQRFTGSSAAVRSSVLERFNEEMKLALAMIPQGINYQV
jgi:hypothetical protein